MSNKNHFRKLAILLTAVSFIYSFNIKAQNDIVIDQVLAVVGKEKILLSDIEQERLRLQMQESEIKGDIKCKVFEDLLVHKLMLHHAELDSIVVTDSQVEGELERRLRYFISQAGSEAALEEYFNKSIYQIKDDLRKSIRENLLAQQMQEKIVKNAAVTPSGIEKFFNELPNDSLPTIPEHYEYRQIVLNPPASAEAKMAVREQLLELRERILKGERFSTLAVAYSEDRASASRGGELGFRSRDELVKDFADVAFNLRDGQVSQVVESEYGFHLIQLIERRNDQVNVRHILMKPSYTRSQLQQNQNKLDSINNLIRADSLTFKRAAQRFSEDEKTRLNGGLVVNQQTGTSQFERDHIPPSDFYVIRKLKVGEISEPFESRDEHGNAVNKVVKLTRIIPQHKANLDDDYAIIQQMAKSNKQQELFMNWIDSNIKSTYIKIDPSYRNCDFEIDGWVK
ncbi:MAG: peptidylprolyl isomerase [Bacteroidales bacterium]